MSADKHPAEVLDDAELVRAMAEAFEAVHGDAIDLRPVAAMLRRIPALEAERDRLRHEVDGLTESCIGLTVERDQLHAEVMEQARLLGMSGERELALRAEIDRLRKDAERRGN